MKIKEIEIIGFKSFVDKINLPFLSGITVLVGPNGCGKSNIVDAIRWAMGEQNARHLRGKSMEDIIFGGSETRKPTGMAEVSLIFSNDNGDAPPDYNSYSEIMVTRRLFRSGESEYYINKVPCRLKDITELFMDTGVGTRSYSIIEQGKIEMLINSKPLDRRLLLEEVAGVLKYKSRKREALSKIESTRQNLVRVNDILVELTTQMNSLKKQAGRLKGYQRLKERIKEKELTLSSRKYREIREKEGETDKLLKNLKDEEMRLDTEIKKVDSLLERKKVEQYEREQSLSVFQKELFENISQMQKCESAIEFNEKELLEIKRRNESAIKELETLHLQMDRERKEVEELEKREGEYQVLLSSEEVKIKEREEGLNRSKEKYQTTVRTIDNEKSALVDLLTEIAHCKNSSLHYDKNLQDFKKRSEKVYKEKRELSERHGEIKKRAEILRGECKGIQGMRSTLEIKKAQREAECQQMEKTREEKENAFKTTNDKLEKSRIQLNSLEELERRYDGYTKGVRSLMSKSESWNKEGNGYHGLLADGLRIETKYEIALEAVLGERLQSLIVDGWETVWEGVDYLKNRAAGRGTFVPLQAVKKNEDCQSFTPPLPEAQPLLSLVEVESAILPVVQYLLKGVWLVNDLRKVIDLPLINDHQLFVTIEGELLDPFGLMTGGNRESLDSGLLRRKRRIRELNKSIHTLEKEYEQDEKAYQETNERLIGIKKDLDSIHKDLQEQNLSLLDREKDLIQAEEGLKEMEQRLKLLLLEEEEVLSLVKETEAERLKVMGIKEEKERMRDEKEINLRVLQDSLTGMDGIIRGEEEEITHLKINQASMREKRENCLSHLLSKKDQVSDLLSRTETINRKVKDEEQRRKELEASLEGTQKQLDELIQSEQRLKEKVDEEKGLAEQGVELLHQMEGRVKELRKDFMEIQPQINELNLKLTEYHLNLDHIKSDMQEKYHLDLEQLWEEFSQVKGVEDKDLSEILQRLKSKLERFGEVNLMAQQELEELKKRHEFLSEQQEDLQETLESLKKMINKINSTIRERFLETFNRVNEKFKEIFPKLFRGGKAELILSEEGDILETGIDIFAQPPGKRLQNMDLLSGGEKSLTAVALLLALFMVKPAPFCLLDEVDSLLDDMNTFRVIEQLKDMAEDSQFILITHNKKTMEAANTLYGITMEEKGVTKVVSVKLS